MAASVWVPTAQAAPAAGTIARVSVANDGSERNFLATGSTTGCTTFVTGKCTKRTVSDAGDKVVFTSRANNLVPGDGNGHADVFLWTRGADPAVTRISVNASGGDADGPSEGPSISPNGEWISFESTATNLKAGDISPGFSDVFVYHVTDGAMYKVSVPSDPTQKPSGNSGGASVANNGNVVFGSFALNMVTGGNGGFQQIYVRRNASSDTAATTEMVSVTDAGAVGDQVGKEAWIDGSGLKVAFTSAAQLTGTEDDVREDDVFVRTLGADTGGTTTRITTDAAAFQPSISSDGSKVAFTAQASLVGTDGDINKDVYTVNAGGGSFTLVSDCCSAAGAMDKPAVVPSISNSGAASFQSFSDFISGVPNEQVWVGNGGTPLPVSKDATSEDLADGVAEFGSISGDAQFVAFSSVATNLVPGDSNGAEDVFLRNMTTGEVVRVSVGPGGVEAAGFQLVPTASPAISADGTIVAFGSDSTNLISGDTNGVGDIFVRSGGTTTRVSVGSGGTQSNGSSYRPSMSADGNLVVFESVASNLVAGDTNGVADVFLHNRATGNTTRVSTSPFGDQPIPSTHGHISPNGKYVAFQSAHTFTNIQASAGRTAIYRYHVDTGVFDLLTRSGERPQDAASRPSFHPTAADNGSVAFASRVRNLVPSTPPEDPNTPQASADDIFVVRLDGSVVQASVNDQGVGADDDNYKPAISADGQHVAFLSKAGNLGGTTSGTTQDVFVRNLTNNTTRMVSVGVGNSVPTGSSYAPAINANGTLIAFASEAENLVAGDNSGTQDVFLANLANGGIERVSVRPGVDGFQPNGLSYTPALSADGLVVAFHSSAANLVDGDTNNAFDTFVRDLAGQLPQPCTSNCGPIGGGGGGGGSGLGYRFVAADGGIFAFESGFHGSMGDKVLNRPIAGMAATPSNNGYWLVATDGGIFSFGDAGFHGSTGALQLNSPIVGMASTPSGDGYWFVAADGGIFAFGDAGFHGSMGGKPLNRPIVGMASTRSGNGYWLVASDGGIFSFGDAGFHGSTGALSLNKPIVGMDRTSSGNGYRFVASDGGIFAFGDASFLGSMGDKALNKPIVGMAKSRAGDGYWLVASDGGIFAFGAAPFFGSTGALVLNSPIVGMAG